jgi:hypothetical protein
MRKSLASLEQFVLHVGHPGASSPEVDDCTLGLTGSVIIKREDSKPPTPLGETVGPGSRGRQSGGLYNGPTSIATHLIGVSGPGPSSHVASSDGAPERWLRNGTLGRGATSQARRAHEL